MAQYSGDIYIGTILLEPNRHKPGRIPSIRVSEWLDRFESAGFHGMELWENHAALVPEEEVTALAQADLPVAVFNSYATFTDADREHTERTTELIRRLGARGVKFNFCRDAALTDEVVRNVDAWRDTLPEGVRLLCECHPGTIAQTPEQAAALFDRLGRDRFQVIATPFADPETLPRWFELLGPMITHAHVQLRDADGMPQRLDRRPNLVRETLRIMREEGFQGSFTLEFTEGMNRPDENVTDLWRNAVLDLAYLRELLA